MDLDVHALLSGYQHLAFPDLSDSRVHDRSTTYLKSASLDLMAFQECGIDIPGSAALLLASFCNILGLYCASSDILVGILSAGTILPCRFCWSAETVWGDLVDEARHSLDRIAGPNITESELKTELGLNEDQSPFTALFVLDDSRPENAYIPDDLLGSPLLLFNPSAALLSVWTSSHLVHPAVADQLLSQIVVSSVHAAQNPISKISSPPSYPANVASAVQCLSSEARASVYQHIRPVTIATDFILPYVQVDPNALAVCWYPTLAAGPRDNLVPETLSYGDLHVQANKLGRYLISQQLKPEDRVAVCMDRNTLFHIVLFGILRAGGCYVPIDPELPDERKSYIAKDSGARFVILESHRHSPEIYGGNVLDLDDDHISRDIQAMTTADIDVALPNNLAYMLYTSGTTGTPKGCLLTHEGLAEAILALSSFSAAVHMDNIRDGRYLGVASVAFDVHLSETLVCLSLGMLMISAPRGILLENLPYYISLLGITHVGIVPSLIDATMGTIQEDEAMGGSKLRFIGSGGEKISDTILEKWADHPKVRLANFYGPSEVTIGCCARFMDSNTPKGNVGRAFSNVAAYVVDQHLDILPRGAVGELVVGGPLVGRGYHGRPDLTDKVFIEWPQKGSWAYRTGDLARMMPDDTLEIIGRIDTQIKLRGVRIEAEGISAVLQRAARSCLQFNIDVGTILGTHPEIGGGSSPQLVSFISWDTGVSITTRRGGSRPGLVKSGRDLLRVLRDACEKELASYMRPAHIIALSWLPLSANGKADIKVLASIFSRLDFNELIGLQDPTGHVDDPDSDSPASDLEERILELLRESFAIASSGGPVGVHTSLFALGMDSLSLARFASILRRAFNINITVAEIMKSPTVRGLSTRLGDIVVSRPGADVPDIDNFSSLWMPEIRKKMPHLNIERVLPSYPIQEGVLFRSESAPTMCVQHIVMRVRDDVSIPQLHSAWEKAVADIDILRTVFFFGKTLVQVLLSRATCHLHWEESSVAASDGETFANHFFDEEATRVSVEINTLITSVPPVRLRLYHQSYGTYIVLSIHHALFDAISLPRILKYVEDAYLDGPLQNLTPPNQILEHTTFRDLTPAREYWTSILRDFNWSYRNLMDVTQSASPKRISITLDTPLSYFQQMLAHCQVTLQAALTCTFASILANRLCLSDDLIFGIIRSGRLAPVEGMGDALIPLLSLVPMRVNLNNPDCLRQVQDDIITAIPFENVPLGQVQKWVRPGAGLFDILFSVMYKDEPAYELFDVVRSELPQPDFFLSVEVVVDVSTDQLILQAAFYDDGSQAADIESMLLQFESEARGVVTSGVPHVTVPQTSLVNRAESTPPVNTANGTHDSNGERGISVALHSVRKIIAEFLGVDPQRLWSRTSFIALGLDSIRSVGLSRALREEGYHVTAAELMKSACLAELESLPMLLQDASRAQLELEARNLFQEQCRILESHFDVATCRFSDRDEARILPTTALQAGMLSQTVISSGLLYNHVFMFKLASSVEHARLRQACQSIVTSFDIFRTTFHYIVDLGKWAQVSHSDAPMVWIEVHLHAGESLDAMIKTVTASTTVSEQGTFKPSLAFCLVEQQEDAGTKNYSLAIAMHHAIYDGISIGALLEELERAYQAHSSTKIPQFYDVLPLILREEHQSIPFWVQHLQDFRPVPLPRAESSTQPSSVVYSRRLKLDHNVLKTAASGAGVTLQCLGQAAWSKFISSKVYSWDVMFGHVVSGRSFPGYEDVIGPMLNTIPCRVRISETTTNRDLLRSIHANNLAALEWQHASLRDIQSETGLFELWDSIFVFQPLKSKSSSPLWSLLNPDESEANIQYPLNCEFHEMDDGFSVTLACLSNIMDPESLDHEISRLEAFLSTIISQPNAKAVADLPFDSRKLPLHSDVSTASIAPRRGIDHLPPALVNVLTSVAKCSVDKLDPDRPIAAIGIDSITAIQLSAKCREAGIALSIADIIACRTIGDLAARVVEVETQPKTHPPQLDYLAPEIDFQAFADRFPSDRRGDLTITRATSGMKWLICAWQRSHYARFQHVFVWRMTQKIDPERLHSSWTEFISRHPILRSTFVSTKSHSDVHIATFSTDKMESSFAVEPFDDSADNTDNLQARMNMIISHPPPTDGPQAYGLLLNGLHNQYLLIRMHHFQYDAWSLALLIEDLSHIYLGQPSSITSDYEAFMSTFAPTPENLQKQEDYWRSTFSPSFRPAYFPQLKPLAVRDEIIPRTIVIAKDVVHGASTLEQRAQVHGVSLQSVLLACWAYIQSSYMSPEQVTFGLWHAGRTGPVNDIDRLAFPCMNVLPMHTRLGSNSIIDVARSIQDDLRLRTPVVQQTDLQMIDKWIGGTGAPLCNVFVNLIRPLASDDEEAGLFGSVDIAYTVPEDVSESDPKTVDWIPTSNLIQDDVMVEIIVHPLEDTITMSIESAPAIMDTQLARKVIDYWSEIVGGHWESAPVNMRTISM
ncbi:uncharacterized protein F5147DRAFT_93647 [Suillus discolor]|uniref:Carrier domain-containing protein n=1 Tax=Suillus discolor TaxID=1912936 RepID=A0A9P7JW26_9AGAM|nr:uncharacterized protein F5147DRAFT_93647 [Suillus discolor]KAG2111633.1 hypothetical protein F5147DRAFT_93647 [Suillus discolor]